MSATVIYTYDPTRDLEGEAFVKRIFKKLDVGVLKLAIDDKVMDALENSPDRDLAAAKMLAKAQKLADGCTEKLRKLLQTLESEVKGLEEKEIHQKVKACRAEMDKQLKELAKELEDLPEEQWAKFLKKYAEAKAEYKKYKLNCAVDITLGTVGVLGSAAAIAGTVHTGGASLVLGIVGGVRSVAKITQVAVTIARDVESQTEELHKELAQMVKDFQSESKVMAVGKDLAKTSLNILLGGAFMTTAATMKKKVELISGKLAGAEVAGVKLSREVTESLNEQRELDKKLAKIEDKKKTAKLEKELEKLQKNFSKLFDKAAEMNDKAERTKKSLKQVKDALVVLEDTTKPLAVIEKVVTFLADAGLAAASAGVGIAEHMGESLELVKESLLFVDEIAKISTETLSEELAD